MIQTLLPMAACSEMFSDVPEATMHSAEAATVRDAVVERRREFATVRYCARQALGRLGLWADDPILPDSDGVPQWPAGVVGSMTHCHGYRAAAVARISDVSSIGIDAEIDSPLPPEMHDLVLRAEERSQIGVLKARSPDTNWGKIFFCAKEAVFKAWYPVTRIWLEFDNVLVTLRDGTFSAFVEAPPSTPFGRTFIGRWSANEGIVTAASWIGFSRPRVDNNRTPAAAHSRPALFESVTQ